MLFISVGSTLNSFITIKKRELCHRITQFFFCLRISHPFASEKKKELKLKVLNIKEKEFSPMTQASKSVAKERINIIPSNLYPIVHDYLMQRSWANEFWVKRDWRNERSKWIIKQRNTVIVSSMKTGLVFMKQKFMFWKTHNYPFTIIIMPVLVFSPWMKI